MNETLKIIAQRYTCRAYDGKLPEKEKIEAVAAAAVQSPSAMNKQPWKIVVITDKNFIDEMDKDGMRVLSTMEDKAFYDRIMERGGKLFYNAPCMFVILKHENTDLDCGIVSENIALAAASLGLGSTICGLASVPLVSADNYSFNEHIGISEEWNFGMAVLVGYAVDSPGTPHEPDFSKIRYVG